MMRMPDSEVIPFAFFEVLLLDYLEGRMTEKEIMDTFVSVCTFSGFGLGHAIQIKGLYEKVLE